jgi:hypothetical protein
MQRVPGCRAMILTGLIIAPFTYALTFTPSEKDVMCILEVNELMKETIPSDSSAQMILPYAISRKAILDSMTCGDVAKTIKAELVLTKTNRCEVPGGNQLLLKVFIGNRSFEVTPHCLSGSSGLFDKDSSMYSLVSFSSKVHDKLFKIAERIRKENLKLGAPFKFEKGRDRPQ